LRGIDVSKAMVEKYNDMARVAGHDQKMYAVQGDLLKNEEIGPLAEFFDFEIAVISMALHHVSNCQELLSKLVARLRHDGIVVVVDWMPGANDQDFTKHHEVHDTIAKESFDKADVIELFTNAGCKATSIVYYEYKETTNLPEYVSGVKGGLEKRFFVAWARRQ
jgi:SAM-dependent methyltransferase